jgi:integrase
MTELTCRDALDSYYKEHVIKKVVDAKRQRIAINHLNVHLGTVEVQNLTLDLIDQYCLDRAPTAGATQRRELNVLRAAISHAIKYRRLAGAARPYIPLPKGSPPKDRWLTHDEVTRLLNATTGSPRLHMFVSLAYHTGSRRRALETLTWGQVDFNQSRIALAKSGERQTNKRRPTVPMGPAMQANLVSAYNTRKTQYVLEHTGDLLVAFKRAAKRAGLDGVTPHTLRHTRAVHLAQRGVSLYTIAGLLGDTVATVERNYLHHCLDHLAATAELELQ